MNPVNTYQPQPLPPSLLRLVGDDFSPGLKSCVEMEIGDEVGRYSVCGVWQGSMVG